MTSVPLLMSTVQAYMGGGTNNNKACEEISSIYLERKADDNRIAKVVARIPASSTRQGHYDVTVDVRAVGSSILGSTCTCPVGGRCKHVYKVLCRIAAPAPIGGPDRGILERQRLVDRMERASVYIALACKSEFDSGSDYRRAAYIKDNYDQEILGVFFSLSQANMCAKTHVQDNLGYDVDWEDEEEDEDDDMEDDDEEYVFDSSDLGDYDDDYASHRVWVERRAIEDASPQFRR